MNTIKKFQFIFLMAFGLLALNSCVQDDEFANPPATCNDGWVSNLTIDQLINQVDDAGEIMLFNTDQIFEGYVVSNDSTGNFFKTISVQDDPTNPTRGIQVEMDRTNLFNNFPLGSKVKVNLNGLHVGYDNVVVKVGDTYVDSNGNTRVGRMANHKIDSHVSITCEGRFDLTPVTFPDIASAKASGILNTLVRIENVQFQTTGVTYADAENQETENRILEGATAETNGQTIILRNSGYATFAGETVPEGSGSITCVLSKYNSDWQLYIRDTNDVQFDNPRFGDGGGSDEGEGPVGGTGASFDNCLDEPFTSFDTNDYEFDKYINYAAVGNRYWQIKDFGSNKYIQMSAHNGDGNYKTYFLVPVNFSDADSFSFKTKDGYNNGNVLKVYYTNNYSGDITTATLTDITSSFTISSGNTSGYGENFIESGEFSLGSLSGNGHIVFLYEGTSGGVTTTMQIDDIRIIDADEPDCENGGGEDPGDEEPELGDGFLFPGADFENWDTFLDGLNNFGIKNYATQSAGNGVGGSAALSINMASTAANDYVFTTVAHSELPSTYSTVKFRVKGTSSKSISINLYKTDGDYYRFNLGDVTADKTIVAEASNQYTGVINTGGEWVEITLDLSGITDLNTNFNTSGDLFALKVGKDVPYALYLDNFTIE